MLRYQLTQLPDRELIRDPGRLVATDRQSTADLLAHLAEVDARKLHIPVARVARAHPAVFAALAAGDLHPSGVRLLAPDLTRENAAGLRAGAAKRSKAQIAAMPAARFPRSDLPTVLAPVRTAGTGLELAPGQAPGTAERAAHEAPSVPERMELSRAEHGALAGRTGDGSTSIPTTT